MELYLMAQGEVAAALEHAASPDPARAETLRLFDEFRAPLRRYLLCAGVAPADADDALQETFLRLYRHLEKRGSPQNLSAWLFQVARNYLRDEVRRARRRRTVQLDDAPESPAGQADPERSALERERARRLRAAIGKLPDQQRECMLLRAAGLRYREIAEALNIEISSVGAAVHRATARLSEELR
jgi:RNA polymerase sigma-70 factor (ECF subfamily)